MAQTSTYMVSGMTCEHCVAAVTTSLSALDGVAEVTIQLAPDGDSIVTVLNTHPLDPRSIREAIADAGYNLIGGAGHSG